MLKLIMKYLLLLLLSLSANSSDKEVAISKSMEAVQSYPIVKTAIDVQTKRIIKMIEMDEDFLKNLAIITYISQTNKISTEKIGN